MKIENQVCSHQQGERLHELGVVKNQSYFQWMQVVVNDTKRTWALFRPNSGAYDWMCDEGLPDELGGEDFETDKECSAFTVAELGVMLPEEIGHKYNEHSSYYYMQGHSDVPVKSPKLWVIWYEDNDLSPELEVLNMQFAAGDTEAEARAAMLIYLLENHLITPEEVNQRLNN